MLAQSNPTLVAARFIAGLPHGAFFGVAALVAARLMGPRNRAKRSRTSPPG
jgi:DHA1 family inner membrane transport protein